MSEALASIRKTRATQSVGDSPNPMMPAPQQTHATIVTSP